MIYCRISQDRGGEGAGVQRQRADCQALADELGWTVVDVFTDNDVSAYSGKQRPEYARMLERLSTGTLGGLLAWHTDRLYRSLPDLADLVRVCDENSVDIRTVKAGRIDLSTPSGRLNASMFASIARYEVERSAERIKAAKDQQALDGKFRGGPRPFGYEADGVTLRETEADALREAADQLLRGVTLMAITRQWKDRGLKTARGVETWTVTALRKVLVRARNAGLVEKDGVIVGPAQWPAIFDVDTLHAVRAVVTDPSRRTSVSYERAHQGAGIYRCGKCGGPMKVYTMGASSGRRYKSYRCVDRPHLSARKEPLDDFVRDVVIERLSRADAAIPVVDDGPDVGALQVQRDGLQARKDELAGLFADGQIDGSQLRRGSADLQTSLGRLDAQLAAARESSPIAGLLGAGDIAGVWEELTPDARGKVIDHLMTVTVLPVGSGQRPAGGGLDPRRVRIEWKQ